MAMDPAPVVGRLDARLRAVRRGVGSALVSDPLPPPPYHDVYSEATAATWDGAYPGKPRAGAEYAGLLSMVRIALDTATVDVCRRLEGMLERHGHSRDCPSLIPDPAALGDQQYECDCWCADIVTLVRELRAP